jgi:hypothetical protein
MTEQELRALVRDAIARHTGASMSPAGTSVSPAPQFRQHASHGMLAVPDGADADGPCVIEPAVPCTHCGYCKSYGH